MDRTISPDLHLIDRLDIGNYSTFHLDNGIPVYFVDAPGEELIKMEFHFQAGRWHETQHAVSRAASNLIKKGTSTKNSKQLAEAVEFYGASIETRHGFDFFSIVIVTLNKYLGFILPVVEEILTDATFPEGEIQLFIQKQKQKLRINSQNTDFHANRKFSEVLFGINHPYGYSINEEDYDALNRQLLLSYAADYFSPGNMTVFMSGQVTEPAKQLLASHFGKYTRTAVAGKHEKPTIITDQQQRFFIPKNDSVQSSIRIGNLSINKQHPDFADFNVLNTLFGGYFGSRLMSNIREDKGYTYGIHSSISHFIHASYFAIETEVGNEVCDDALREIYAEMARLRNQTVNEDELTIVRNYLMGSLQRATDGPFNRINVIKNIITSDLDTSYFNGLVSSIQSITVQRLQELANLYLREDQMKEVICGKRNGS